MTEYCNKLIKFTNCRNIIIKAEEQKVAINLSYIP